MLYSKETAKNNLCDFWKLDALEKFDQKLTDKIKPFPCIPAALGHSFQHLRFGFVSDPRSKSSSKELAKILREYSQSFQGFGAYTSLIVFYESPENLIETATIEDYEILFWEQLKTLNTLDSKEWPPHIPVNSNHPLWEFCFHGIQYFMYCATPAHQNRQSRHFHYFMLAITPRNVLEQNISFNPHAEQLKNAIRERLSKLDSISIHPDLNSYGQENNFEWKQYFLHDDNSSITKCPFHNN